MAAPKPPPKPGISAPEKFGPTPMPMTPKAGKGVIGIQRVETPEMFNYTTKKETAIQNAQARATAAAPRAPSPAPQAYAHANANARFKRPDGEAKPRRAKRARPVVSKAPPPPAAAADDEAARRAARRTRPAAGKARVLAGGRSLPRPPAPRVP